METETVTGGADAKEEATGKAEGSMILFRAFEVLLIACIVIAVICMVPYLTIGIFMVIALVTIAETVIEIRRNRRGNRP